MVGSKELNKEAKELLISVWVATSFQILQCREWLRDFRFGSTIKGVAASTLDSRKDIFLSTRTLIECA